MPPVVGVPSHAAETGAIEFDVDAGADAELAPPLAELDPAPELEPAGLAVPALEPAGLAAVELAAAGLLPAEVVEPLALLPLELEQAATASATTDAQATAMTWDFFTRTPLG